MVYLLKHCNTAAKKPKCTVYKKVIEKHYCYTEEKKGKKILMYKLKKSTKTI